MTSQPSPSSLPAAKGELVAQRDIAELCRGASAQTVSNWRRRHASTFPVPRIGGRSPQFDLGEVLDWLAGNRRPMLEGADLALWMWRRTVASTHEEMGGSSTTGGTAAARSLLVALVLLRTRQRLTHDGAQGDTRTELRSAAAAAEAGDESLSGLLVAPLREGLGRGSQIDTTRLQTILDRLDAALDAGCPPAELAESVLTSVVASTAQSTSTATAPLLATAMALAGNPSAGDTVLDLAAGEGTLLLECASIAGGTTRLLGVELETEPARIARTRALLRDPIVHLDVTVGDSLKHPVGTERADLVLIDPPIGPGTPPIREWVAAGLAHLAPAGRLVIDTPATADSFAELGPTIDAGFAIRVVVMPPRTRGDTAGPVWIWVLGEGGDDTVGAVELVDLRRRTRLTDDDLLGIDSPMEQPVERVDPAVLAERLLRERPSEPHQRIAAALEELERAIRAEEGVDRADRRRLLGVVEDLRKEFPTSS